MKVIDLLEVCKGAPYVRIIAGNQDGEVLADGYNTPVEFDLIPYHDALVLEFYARYETRHKKFAELGLLPPYRPDLTAQYEFADIKQTLYYDIIVEG
ncbi:MAG: hypothetical protein NC548_26585 [Lachnospiraceae bacterium]|nr:hypothetical protein [Lachnospiraceae bacterium]